MLSDYIKQFLELNTAKRMGQVAPHKAVMLLSVMSLIEEGVIDKPLFYLSEALENRFKRTWAEHVGDSVLFQPIPATPFYHMGSEPFWKLFDENGARLEKMTTTPSISYLRDKHIAAFIDDELFEYMKVKESRERLRTTLVSNYLRKDKSQLRKVLPLFIGMVATRLLA